ncbi:hypothetical protein [Spirosoma linguale]|uniref:Uncharacterized protein n=1 Tax=Spirosoma linguale (strain ATCC 33905 / DSM 74 / LMG 10896 / Claus 1) TaxID=504472 RepID=D2QLI9_SPILD|nr:hypothetical protein Slin_4297 [Spirosoma linguale DSM 74]
MGVLGRDIVINEALANKLNQTPDGKAFLDKYNKFALIYGGVRVSDALLGLSKSLRSSATVLNDPEVTNLATELSAEAVQTTGLLDNAFLSGWTKERILAQKPRPSVAEYINPTFEAQHLDKFKGKAYRFTMENAINKYGVIGREDGFVFILAEEDALRIVNEAGSDIAKLEKALGLPEGQFQKPLNNPVEPDRLLLLEINSPENLHLRMANGNEKGANEYWIPGGYTPDNLAEAVIDAIPTTRIDLYKKIEIARTK